MLVLLKMVKITPAASRGFTLCLPSTQFSARAYGRYG
jgi:hypothetical protein